MTARLHFHQDLLYPGHAQFETADHVVSMDGTLRFDRVEQRDIVFEHQQAFVRDRRIPVSERLGYAKRVVQLQAETAFLAKCAANKSLERLEAARLPDSRLSLLRL